MTSVHRPTRPFLTSPIIDCEPPPLGSVPCPPPAPATLRRRVPGHLRRVSAACPGEVPPPQAAAVFADAALRRVLEVVDRRRPVTQLRGLLAPTLIDAAATLSRTPQPGGAAILRRVRLRCAVGNPIHPDEPRRPIGAAEVFATYTRGTRVRAIAARIEMVAERWQVVALQIG